MLLSRLKVSNLSKILESDQVVLSPYKLDAELYGFCSLYEFINLLSPISTSSSQLDHFSSTDTILTSAADSACSQSGLEFLTSAYTEDDIANLANNGYLPAFYLVSVYFDSFFEYFEIIAKNPDIIFGCHCGKKVQIKKIIEIKKIEVQTFIADQNFKNRDYTQTRLPKGEYENCVFEGCNFEQGYLDNQNFIECEFIDCNFSNANLAHTIFNEVSFSHCKMLGLKFEDCNDFLIAFSFHDCVLNYSSFYGLKLKNQLFSDCKLIEVDFTEADLTEADLDTSDLERATFYETNLQPFVLSWFRLVNQKKLIPT